MRICFIFGRSADSDQMSHYMAYYLAKVPVLQIKKVMDDGIQWCVKALFAI